MKEAKIKDLLPDDRNMNKGTEYGNSLIENSLRKFGAGRSILIDKNNRIIAGNKTIENASQIGLEDILIVETDGHKIVAVKRNDIDLDTQIGRELALADNATSKANIAWDEDELKAIEEDFMITAADWGVGEFDLSLENEAEEDDYEMPDEIKTDIVPGDLFEIGQHRLLCGDSTDSDQVAKLMNLEKADMVFTDPDYSMNDNDLFSCYNNSLIYIKENFSFWVCADKQAVKLSMNDFDNFTHFFIHNYKVPTMISGTQPMTKHNMICKFGNKKMNNLKDGFSTIVDVATERTLESHKVTRMSKRVELPGAFISHYSQRNEIVLDIFCHSGSTMVAAHQLNRKCYGMEIDPKYCQVIIDRMRKLDPDIVIKKNGEIIL